MATKFSDWVFSELPPLPDKQILATDSLVVIRAGVPYSAPLNATFAYGSMADNAVETTINTVDVWESIVGAIVDSGLEESFTWFGNVLSYIGEDMTIPEMVYLDFTLLKTGGPVDTDIYQVGLFKNGALVGVGASTTIVNSNTESGSLTLPVIFAQGDTLEVKVRNRTDADNVTVKDMQLTVK